MPSQEPDTRQAGRRLVQAFLHGLLWLLLLALQGSWLAVSHTRPLAVKESLVDVD